MARPEFYIEEGVIRRNGDLTCVITFPEWLPHDKREVYLREINAVYSIAQQDIRTRIIDAASYIMGTDRDE